MIINITEEQKKIIESQGYMVIEFKLWVNKSMPLIHRFGFGNKMDTYRLLMTFFSCKFTIGITKKLEEIGVWLTDTLKPLLDEFSLDDSYIESKDKYPFIRSLGRKYEMRYRKPVIYHRCRNNC